MKHYLFTILAALLLAGCSYSSNVADNGNSELTVFKSPSCGCCNGHVDAYDKAGFDVTVQSMQDLDSIKKQHNIPADMLSCHTAVVGDYFIEGHVPLVAVEKLLQEKPDIDGIALPGMPAGSPGMPGVKSGTWTIYAIKDGQISEFMTI